MRVAARRRARKRPAKVVREAVPPFSATTYLEMAEVNGRWAYGLRGRERDLLKLFAVEADDAGRVVLDTRRFPSGFKALIGSLVAQGFLCVDRRPFRRTAHRLTLPREIAWLEALDRERAKARKRRRPRVRVQKQGRVGCSA